MDRQKWMKALALSACLFVLWWALGTGATLAWFSDTDTVRNEFQIGLIDLEVSYKNDTMNDYDTMESDSPVFYDEALYEPGYTQVAYLKIENKGDIDFKYKVSVTVESVTEAKNVWNEDLYLPDYLRFGVVFAESEAALKLEVKERLQARDHADADMSQWEVLGTWSEISPYIFEAKEKPHYAALIVYMPEEVGNAANYRGSDVPEVKLGITVFAQQANAPIK